MAAREDNITTELKEEKRVTSPPPETNYTMVDKITRRLIAYLNEQKIDAFAPIVREIESRDAAYKLSFIRVHLCPRVNGLRAQLEDHLRQSKVTVPSVVLDKIERFMKALCEVAEQ